MQEGEIKESGTHEELINLKSEYFKLYNTQKELENYSSAHKKDKKIHKFEKNSELKNEPLNTDEKSPRGENEEKL